MNQKGPFLGYFTVLFNYFNENETQLLVLIHSKQMNYRKTVRNKQILLEYINKTNELK